MAKAAYFPSISLTGTAGFQSDALTRLFTGPAGLWTAGPSLTQPIFEGGRLSSNVRLTEAQKQQELLTYESTIQEAFREVSDSLIAYQKDREFREQQRLLTTAAQGAAHLSDIRYRGGTASYLEVLTNDTNYFSAELNLVQAQLNERLSRPALSGSRRRLAGIGVHDKVSRQTGEVRDCPHDLCPRL